ncbi:MAG: dihydropteroate synthase [Nitrospirae bacterium]|nr:dihydropteroate synthase [Nitrospirota bacterium]
MPTSNTAQSPEALRARGRAIPLDAGPLLMGILNVTPDSFSDGGLYLDPEAAVAHAMAMVEQGADLIDIGAESSRPGSDPVGEEEEIRRLIPVVSEVCRRASVPVSVDTTKAGVARRALDAGAAIINDISALRSDPRMGQVVAEAGAGLVLMHMQGTPKTMHLAPSYRDVVAEVRQFLAERMRAAQDVGVCQEQILLDPGIGFGKNLEHNLSLLEGLESFASLGRPILVGVSRKAFIGQVLDRPIGERLMGTAAAVAIAILGGARVLRVHDVAQMRDVVKVAHAFMRRRAQ